jgi:hypothetical protein
MTDAMGTYRIENLDPGAVTVTFRLVGYRDVVVRTVVAAGRPAIVDANMVVAPVTETITISDPPPPVDTRTVTRSTELYEDTILAIPNRRNYNSLLVLVPGVTTERNDVVVDPLATAFPFHGGRTNEGRLLIDGLSVGSAPLGGSPAEYLADITTAEAVTFTAHAIDSNSGLGSVETGGLVMNVVPSHGGNVLTGSASFAGNSASMQGDNVSQELRGFGIGPVQPIERAWEAGGAVGGPIVHDRAFYFVSGRRQSLRRLVPGLYFNSAAGNPASFQYVRDFTRPVYSDRTWENVNGRLTFQPSQHHRFSVFVDEQAICRSCTGATSASGFPDTSVSPEAQGVGDYPGQRVQQIMWSAPFTNRLLIDARFGRSAYTWGNGERDDNNRSLVRVTGTPQFGGPTVAYRSQDWAENHTASNTWQATASYVRPSHVFKAGYQGLFATDDRTSLSNDQSVTYRLPNGIPNSLVEVIAPYTVLTRVEQTSAYLQDSWSAGRLTLHGALRFDRVRSWSPEQRIGPTRFLHAGVVFPKTTGVDAYADLTPRMGVAYDVRDNGRTAVKISGGKYLEGAGTSGIYFDSNPATRLVTSASRSWSDTNGNFVPNCVLETPVANGECGSTLNTLFGQVDGFTVDPSLLRGAGVRPSDWSVAASVEQEIGRRGSVAVGYHRRWFDGFTVVDNLLIGPSDFRAATVTLPQSTTLPASGQPLGPLYIQNTATVGRFQQVLMPADRYGDQSRRSDSFDVVVTTRADKGLTFQGGTSTTWVASDSCAVRDAVPESAPLNPYCRVSTGPQTQFRGLATYLLPRVGVQLGAVYQNKPGAMIAASGTAFAPPTGFLTVNFVEPGTVYGERISQLDLRAVKQLSIGGARVLAGVDLYNAFNSAGALTYSQNFLQLGTASLPVYPTSVLTPRILRVTADVRF